jgi:hypothetical protein
MENSSTAQEYDSDDSLLADIIQGIFTETDKIDESTSDMDIDNSFESPIMKRQLTPDVSPIPFSDNTEFIIKKRRKLKELADDILPVHICVDEKLLKSPLILREQEEPDELIRMLLKQNRSIFSLANFVNSPYPQEDKYCKINEEYTTRRDYLFAALIKEKRLKHAFTKLLQLWNIYKLDKKFTPIDDIITLSPIKKPVYIYDFKLKQKFTFEALSIANSIKSGILYYEQYFAAPKYPKNYYTNTEFKYEQLVSIYYQVLAHGVMNWVLSTYKECDFYLHRWCTYHKPHITMNAISNEICKLETYEGRELLIDFMINKIEELSGTDISDYVVKLYEYAVTYMADHNYIQRFKNIAIRHFEAEHFKLPLRISINLLCTPLVNYHPTFMNAIIDNITKHSPS